MLQVSSFFPHRKSILFLITASYELSIQTQKTQLGRLNFQLGFLQRFVQGRLANLQGGTKPILNNKVLQCRALSQLLFLLNLIKNHRGGQHHENPRSHEH